MTAERVALVTGAGGFVGGHLVARLAAEGWRVVAAHHRPPAARDPSDAEAPRTLDRVLDVRDATAVEALIGELRPAVCFHLAARVSVPRSMAEPAADAAVNLLGAIHVARACVAAGVPRLVHFSSGGAVYGEPQRSPVEERHPLRPRSVYGASKAASELYLRVLTPGSGTPGSGTTVAVLRTSNVYGPARDATREHGVVGIFAGRMLRGEPVTIFGDGDEERDYVYVDDVVEAALAAAAGEPATCNVASGVGTTTRRLFQLVVAETAYALPPRWEPARPGELHGVTLSPALAAERWGWRPRVALEEGVRRVVASIAGRGRA